MSNYSYTAVDPGGVEMRGILEVGDVNEALRRIREMGLFPVKVAEVQIRKPRHHGIPTRPVSPKKGGAFGGLRFGGKVAPARLAIFTRQLATLIEAGMPLLRGLKTLREQEGDRVLRRVIGELAVSIENGSSLTEAVAAHPGVFNKLYTNMVKAGEIAGALEITLRRLAEFMEKAQKLRGRIKAALFYPCTVLLVAAAIMSVLMVFVVPKFKVVFEGLLNGMPLPAFSRFVFNISEVVRSHFLIVAACAAAAGVLIALALQTNRGRWAFDRLKLAAPVLGPLFQKAAISRFTRTLGTLARNGVPILQALTIVKETAGNVVMGKLIGTVHDKVKEGESIAPTLKASSLFPTMVAGMVDVGEQTGALPDMLLKIADTYDEEVDNAAAAMTSLLEPVMIVFLAVVVGSIVIAMFLPLVAIIDRGFDQNGGGTHGE